MRMSGLLSLPYGFKILTASRLYTVKFCTKNFKDELVIDCNPGAVRLVCFLVKKMRVWSPSYTKYL